MAFSQQNCQNLLGSRSTHLAVKANKGSKTITLFNDQYIILLSSLVREALRRQGLKVVFFGRTSCGKSTLINALLGEPALPTGLGTVQQILGKV
jgi:predicted GTPase